MAISDFTPIDPPEGLSEQDIKVARYAARLAVQEMERTFYARVGKSVVTRWLVIIGAMAAAFTAGGGKEFFK
jgi:hypothetical protein